MDSARTGSLCVDGRPARIVLVVNEDWMFWSHRLSLARAARDHGADVTVATRVGAHAARMSQEGFRVVPLPWRRGARNPLPEVRAVRALSVLYRDVRPDLVHHVGVKAALYGGFAALFAGRLAQVHTVAGFGWVSTADGALARVLRALVHAAFRYVLSHPRAHLVVQNAEDEAEVRALRLFDGARIHLIRGSGVDTRAYTPAPEPAGAVTAVLASRLIRPKGVAVLAAAARLLHARGVGVRVVLVGDPDPENPDTVTESELRAWHAEGIVEWVARVDDMAAVWRSAHIGVLPSYYREGVPKTLLEAAACGRPLVATDTPGCRDIVHDGDNGLLVPAHDAGVLADAIERLASDPALRARMGARSREIVEQQFSDEIVVGRMLDLYRLAMGARP